jgi:hypothetical protein
MYGVLYFFVLGAHLLFSLLMIKIAVAMAKARGKPGWYYGLPAGLLVFSLLYWDLIPTHAVHRYYCISEGGFTVYKTLVEWKHENPGVAETLIPKKNLL